MRKQAQPAGELETLADTMRACLETPGKTLSRVGELAHQHHVRQRHYVDTEAAKLGELFLAVVEGANA
jgi:hypothetical protein